jgi:hypothetical protein
MIMRSYECPADGEVATVFISHAHSYKFMDVISALKWHLRNEPETIVWFDLFSINQHIMTTRWGHLTGWPWFIIGRGNSTKRNLALERVWKRFPLRGSQPPQHFIDDVPVGISLP